MILPIVAYGSTVLKKKTKDLSNDHPNVKQLIENMWETMYASNGVGLAAPQIGLSLRLFVVDTAPFADDEALDIVDVKILESFKKVFINPTIIEEDGEIWEFNEGCLSIPDIREDVSRHERIKMNYLDEYFKPQTIILSGLVARVVQHEYDHIEGILFTDHLSPLKRRLLKAKLTSISKGAIEVEYPMKFPLKTKR
ncbi:peptide deformylase [Flavobacteriaceae bacterium]|jgi:peptide deformylase|nr:peptide deformylase [Flavobacteriaceae bacterium]MDB4062964.1 peptide deformylase [Flavobacteriaceae bacterium]MDB4255957.1 peptide deformylase [Flavobacteriaceae bacterium]MDC0001526.1 peptide deformylase [Flavobacteriaceae bacterium]MDC1392652.1 peptide deformylase [Flavobacteriaceae bacterium]|tara:strand:+ start:276 stop:863 length:588 start_codon:yes stop_codon:yes gene_type:complete